MSHSRYFDQSFHNVDAQASNGKARPSLATLLSLTPGALVRTAFAIFLEIQRLHKARRTARQLSDLDDYMLQDIGLQRWEIRTVAEAMSRNPGVDLRAILARQ